MTVIRGFEYCVRTSFSLVGSILLMSCSGVQHVDQQVIDDIADTEHLASLNAQARQGAVEEDIFETTVFDPYRGLESDSDQTWHWIDSQVGVTQDYLDTHDSVARAERLEALLSIGYISGVKTEGGRVFYEERGDDTEQALLYVIDDEGASPRVLLDPNALGERVSLDWYYPSPGGNFMAYGLSSEGDEKSTLYVLDVTTGLNLGDEIPHTKWVSLSWLKDESGFYYTRYPFEDEPDYDPENEDSYHRNLFFHQLGDDPGDDPMVFAAPESTQFISASTSTDDQFLFITVWQSWSANDLYVWDLAGGASEPLPVALGEEQILYGSTHEGQAYFFTNRGHPRGQILTAAVDSAEDFLDWSTWEVLVPESEGNIEGFYLSSGHLIVDLVEDVSSTLRYYNLETGDSGGAKTGGSLESACSIQRGP